MTQDKPAPTTTNSEDDEVVIHVCPTYSPCDHKWNEGDEPEFCVKCGMSFIRYIFTECP